MDSFRDAGVFGIVSAGILVAAAGCFLGCIAYAGATVWRDRRRPYRHHSPVAFGVDDLQVIGRGFADGAGPDIVQAAARVVDQDMAAIGVDPLANLPGITRISFGDLDDTTRPREPQIRYGGTTGPVAYVNPRGNRHRRKGKRR